MAEGIDISLFDDDDGATGGVAGGLDQTNKLLEDIKQTIDEAQTKLGATIQQAVGGGGGGEGGGEDAIGAAGGGKGLGGMFSSALGKASAYLAMFNQAVQGVQKALGMLQQALSAFADVNAVVAIAFERLQLFLRGVLVVLGETLAPVLDELTNIFKEIISLLLTIFVEIFMLLRPVIMAFLNAIKGAVQWLNRLLGIKPLNIEEQGLRRSATGVANVLAQFAGAAQNPQGQPPVNVNIMGGEEFDFDAQMGSALDWGRGFVADKDNNLGWRIIGAGGRILGGSLFGPAGFLFGGW